MGVTVLVLKKQLIFFFCSDVEYVRTAAEPALPQEVVVVQLIALLPYIFFIFFVCVC